MIRSWWQKWRQLKRREEISRLRRSVLMLRRNARLIQELESNKAIARLCLELVERALGRLRKKRQQLLAH